MRALFALRSLLITQGPGPIPRENPIAAASRTFQTTDRQNASGTVLNEGTVDIQLRRAEGRILLLR